MQSEQEQPFDTDSVAGAMGGLAIGVTGTSLCLCQPYRSQFDIELKRGWDKKILILGILYYKILKSID